MDEATVIKLMKDCGMFGAKFGETDARMIFQRVKLGRKAEIDFDRFLAVLQETAKAKGVPYDELISTAWLQLQVALAAALVAAGVVAVVGLLLLLRGRGGAESARSQGASTCPSG